MLEFRDVSKSFAARDGRRMEALRSVSGTISEGEFVSFIGPSGCGKTTLLSILGGLLPADRGDILLNGGPVTRPEPRHIAYVFQSYDLLPWRTVTRNVSYGLELRGSSRGETAEATRSALELVGLSEFADHYPEQLSGGMQQRVAIARALALGAPLLLLDEPFGALDEQTRLQLGDEILSLWTATRKTIVLVTHSLQEATYLSDRIFVFSRRPGRIKRVIESPLPRPRHPAMMNDPTFSEVRALLWEELSAEWTE